jgi:hypothetical protein
MDIGSKQITSQMYCSTQNVGENFSIKCQRVSCQYSVQAADGNSCTAMNWTTLRNIRRLSSNTDDRQLK